MDIEACNTLKINFHESCENTFVFEGEDLNALIDSFISNYVRIDRTDDFLVICA